MQRLKEVKKWSRQYWWGQGHRIVTQLGGRLKQEVNLAKVNPLWTFSWSELGIKGLNWGTPYSDNNTGKEIITLSCFGHSTLKKQHKQLLKYYLGLIRVHLAQWNPQSHCWRVGSHGRQRSWGCHCGWTWRCCGAPPCCPRSHHLCTGGCPASTRPAEREHGSGSPCRPWLWRSGLEALLLTTLEAADRRWGAQRGIAV